MINTLENINNNLEDFEKLFSYPLEVFAESVKRLVAKVRCGCSDDFDKWRFGIIKK